VETYEFGQKREAPITDSPGPGHYRENIEMTKDRVKNVLFAPEKPIT
jgi:hypothetical protein